MADRPRADAALRHPLRAALLKLVEEVGTLTANDAARRLGESSGACSFHLRQLARYGLIEESGTGSGRERPWRLRQETPADLDDRALAPLARELEDEGYRRWLELRDQAPPQWRRDEAFSLVLHLTPEELSTVANAVRAVLAPYEKRSQARLPEGAAPVGFITRVFPLLPTATTDAARPESDRRGHS